MTWQPIETAPMDGTNILLTPGDDYRIVVGWGHGPSRTFRSMEGELDGGCECCGTWVSAKAIRPTHWMPLPDPPAVERDLTKMEAGK
jgi:hypothetical protein